MTNKPEKADLIVTNRADAAVDGWMITDQRGSVCQYIYFHKENAQIAAGPYSEIKPVCLVDPSELARLRAVDEWAKEHRDLVLDFLHKSDDPIYLQDSINDLDAITATKEPTP